MKENFKNYLIKNSHLTEEEFEAIFAVFRSRNIKKLDYVFIEDELIDKIYFLSSGILRGYYVNESKETTSSFYFANNMFSDFLSLRENIPTRLNIQALKDSEIIEANFKEIEILMLKFPNIQLAFFNYFEELFLSEMALQHSFIYDLPEERYMKLFSDKPKVILEIPQYYISSYIGIKPETLSRIKKRIFS